MTQENKLRGAGLTDPKSGVAGGNEVQSEHANSSLTHVLQDVSTVWVKEGCELGDDQGLVLKLRQCMAFLAFVDM